MKAECRTQSAARRAVPASNGGREPGERRLLSGGRILRLRAALRRTEEALDVRRQLLRAGARPAFCVRGRCSGLSLIEILIALFIFLFGVLGVLSLFPVAMSTAGRSIGETRATVLARSALAQVKFDCTMPYEVGRTDPATPSTNNTLVRESSSASLDDYYVTVVGGLGRGQSRRITGNAGRTLNVAPDWTVVPEMGAGYVITRLGLPDVPLPGAPFGAGLNRSLVFWGKGTRAEEFYPGIPSTHDIVLDATNDPWQSGSNPVEPFTGFPAVTNAVISADGTTITSADFAGRIGTSNQFCNYQVRAWTSPPNARLQVRRITGNPAGNQLTVTPAFGAPLAGSTPERLEIGWSNAGQWTAADTPASASPTAYIVITNGRPSGRVYAVSESGTAFVKEDFSAGTVSGANLGGPNSTTVNVSPPGWTYDANKKYVFKLRRASSTVTPPPGDLEENNLHIRRIENYNAGVVTVSPAWPWSNTPAGTHAYEIVPLHRIVLSAADFDRHQVKTAESGGRYALQDATSFTLIGPGRTVTPGVVNPPLVTFLPQGDIGALPGVPARLNRLNEVSNPWRVIPDTFGIAGNPATYGSEHSCVAVFSDGGGEPADPVRVDVFVYRNFNGTKDLSDNQKPVGFATGYIERP